MENAAEALKIAFAVFIFVIALAVSFFMVSQARHTADAVFAINDDSKYFQEGLEGVTYLAASDSNNEQIVGWDAVVATIYRYNSQGYGVTIKNRSGDIIARFNTTTESIVSKIFQNKKTNQDASDVLTYTEQEYMENLNIVFGFSDNNNYSEWHFDDIYYRTKQKNNGQYFKWLSGNANDLKERLENDLGNNNPKGLGLEVNYKEKQFLETIEIIENEKPNGETEEFIEIIFQEQ